MPSAPSLAFFFFFFLPVLLTQLSLIFSDFCLYSFLLLPLSLMVFPLWVHWYANKWALWREKKTNKPHPDISLCYVLVENALAGNSGGFEFNLQNPCKGGRREPASESCPLNPHVSTFYYLFTYTLIKQFRWCITFCFFFFHCVNTLTMTELPGRRASQSQLEISSCTTRLLLP